MGAWWNTFVNTNNANDIVVNGCAQTIDGWSNLPVAGDGWGTLACFAAGTENVIQLYYSWNTGKLFWRSKHTTWQSWKRIDIISQSGNTTSIPFKDNIRIQNDNDYLYTHSGGGLQVKNYNGDAFAICFASAFSQQSSKYSKENVNDMSIEEAKKILELNPVSFDYKEKFGGAKNNFGLIAEETNKIIPSCVTIPKKYNEEECEKGNIDINNLPSIDYSKLVPYLIKMVQYQEERINSLESK